MYTHDLSPEYNALLHTLTECSWRENGLNLEWWQVFAEYKLKTGHLQAWVVDGRRLTSGAQEGG